MKTIFKSIIVRLLIIESRLILKKYRPSIIAVTGSVGKTSTKDAIYTVLKNSCYVRKSEKSFNSEIGVPLTILGCQNAWSDPVMWIKNIFVGLELVMFKSKYPECLVLEVGADHPGDIRNLGKWLKPDIAVITKVSEVPVHVEFFPSPEAVLEEKFSLAQSLKKNGTLVVSADDARLMEAAKGITQKVLTFGLQNKATITATDMTMDIARGISFKLNYEGNSIPLSIKGVLGNQHIYPLIAAAAVGIARGISISKIIDSLGNHVAPKGRMNIIAGVNGSYIIDDTYNSSPDALSEAFTALDAITVTGRKIAVLGDMMELGKFSPDEHRKAGERAQKSCNVLITVGPRAKLMGDGEHFDSAEQAGEYVKGIVAPGDVVLVKGSQSIRLERVTKALMAGPEKASEMLVRQEQEWLNKK